MDAGLAALQRDLGATVGTMLDLERYLLDRLETEGKASKCTNAETTSLSSFHTVKSLLQQGACATTYIVTNAV
jgi:hypothetical protein